ncbi:hypothetical protein GOBAR_DD24221 [Gossypium barbadense]|nr:hypothetical protein GOBAR_DD24221 [Gossypium barbadense]
MGIFARSFVVIFSCILLLNGFIAADHHVIEGDKHLLHRLILNKDQEDGQEHEVHRRSLTLGLLGLAALGGLAARHNAGGGGGAIAHATADRAAAVHSAFHKAAAQAAADGTAAAQSAFRKAASQVASDVAARVTGGLKGGIGGGSLTGGGGGSLIGGGRSIVGGSATGSLSGRGAAVGGGGSSVGGSATGSLSGRGAAVGGGGSSVGGYWGELTATQPRILGVINFLKRSLILRGVKVHPISDKNRYEICAKKEKEINFGARGTRRVFALLGKPLEPKRLFLAGTLHFEHPPKMFTSSKRLREESSQGLQSSRNPTKMELDLRTQGNSIDEEEINIGGRRTNGTQ